MARIRDLTGQKFGRLTVIKKVPNTLTRSGSVIWECVCDCGNIKRVSSASLTSGQVKSCGCLHSENRAQVLRDNREKIKEKNFIEGTNINMINRSEPIKSNTSGVPGVYWVKASKKWRACINFKKTFYHLGYFSNKEDAIKARKEAEERFYKPFLEEHKRDL